MPSAPLRSSPTASICSSECQSRIPPLPHPPQRRHELDRSSLCYQGWSSTCGIPSHRPSCPPSFPIKAQILMILATPTAGTGQRSLPLSSTVFSSWHSASRSRWRLSNASSARLVCTISYVPNVCRSILAEISNPRLVVIVGSFGLASNIVGLFLFHGAAALFVSSPT